MSLYDFALRTLGMDAPAAPAPAQAPDTAPPDWTDRIMQQWQQATPAGAAAPPPVATQPVAAPVTQADGQAPQANVQALGAQPAPTDDKSGKLYLDDIARVLLDPKADMSANGAAGMLLRQLTGENAGGNATGQQNYAIPNAEPFPMPPGGQFAPQRYQIPNAPPLNLDLIRRSLGMTGGTV